MTEKIKSLSFKELDQFIDRANHFTGASIEDVIFYNDLLLLLLKKSEQKVFMIADVRAKPFFIVTTARLPGFKKQIKPIYLFLKAHFLGSAFLGAEVRKEFGRLVILRFSEGREIELHLFPQARNIIIKKEDLQISLHKITELKPLGDTFSDPNPRSVEQIEAEWIGLLNPSPKELKSGEDPRDKILRKKNQGLKDLEKKQKELQEAPWSDVALWLAQHRDLNVPEEWRSIVDQDQSVQWNIERAFSKAKQVKEKLQAIETRRLDLQKEIHDIQTLPITKTVPSTVAEKTAITGAQGRTKILNDQVRAFIGKSAADNLKILRQSKAWHLWLHVKELPGSHGIIAFNKGEVVSQEHLREVARWVVEQSLSAKQRDDWQGVKCEVIYCECRFVTPIRGDKLGRVTYKNEKSLTVVV